ELDVSSCFARVQKNVNGKKVVKKRPTVYPIKSFGEVPMRPKYIHILSILLTVVYGLFVVFLYATEPRTIAEVSDRAGETVDSVVNKGQIITGTYEVDAPKFAEGLRAFRADNFPLARDRFIAADPERRDAKTQFYIAYSYYRQGWGRFSNDDELFKKGLAETEKLVRIDPDF